MKIKFPNGLTIELEGVYNIHDAAGRIVLNAFNTLEVRPVVNPTVDNRNYDWRPVRDGQVVNQEQYNQGFDILFKFVNKLNMERTGSKACYNNIGLVNFFMIAAIKEVRAKTNACLKEAKEFVDYVANTAIEEEIGPNYYNPMLVKTALYEMQRNPKLVSCSYKDYLKDIPLFKRQDCIQEDEFWAARCLIKQWGLPEVKQEYAS